MGNVKGVTGPKKVDPEKLAEANRLAWAEVQEANNLNRNMLFSSIAEPTELENDTKLIMPEAYERHLLEYTARRENGRSVTNKRTMSAKQLEAWRTDPLWQISSASPHWKKIIAKAEVKGADGKKYYIVKLLAKALYDEFHTGAEGISVNGDFNRTLAELRKPRDASLPYQNLIKT